jgi:predicted RNA-binding protein (virulence factor B family)
MISDQTPPGEYQPGQPVELMIKTMTDLGYKVVVDGKYWGVLYYDEVFQQLDKDQAVLGFIKTIRPDGKLDLTLYKTGNRDAKDIGDLIIDELTKASGYLALDSKTPAEEIYNRFGVSKKKFKIALGGLYKKRLIEIRDDGIHLIPLPLIS